MRTRYMENPISPLERQLQGISSTPMLLIVGVGTVGLICQGVWMLGIMFGWWLT